MATSDISIKSRWNPHHLPIEPPPFGASAISRRRAGAFGWRGRARPGGRSLVDFQQNWWVKLVETMIFVGISPGWTWLHHDFSWDFNDFTHQFWVGISMMKHEAAFFPTKIWPSMEGLWNHGFEHQTVGFPVHFVHKSIRTSMLNQYK